MSAAKRAHLQGQAALLDLLAAANPATLGVASRPAGAEVQLDGIALGKTPLQVALRPGHRLLTLALEGHGPVSEHVQLPAGAVTRRDFDLRPAQRIVASRPTRVVAPAKVETPRPASRASRPAAPSRSELYATAQKRRARRDWRGAAKAYRSVIRRFSGSAEGAIALVSLGVLELRYLGSARRALKYFDRYLRRHPGGPLAQEAAHGRLSALRRMGRHKTERQAIRSFLSRYPSSLRAGRLRKRLNALLEKP